MNEDENLDKLSETIADKLIKLGYADSIIRNDLTGLMEVRFTESGLAFQSHLRKILPECDISTDAGFSEFQALFFLIMRSK